MNAIGNRQTPNIVLLLLLAISGLILPFISCEKENSTDPQENREAICRSPVETIAHFLELSATPREVAAAFMYLRLEGVAGESMDKDHKDWIDLFAASFVMSVDMNGQSGVRTFRGTHTQGFTFNKMKDKASAALKEAQVLGRIFPEVTLSIRKNTGGQEEEMTVKLSNVRITSHSLNTGADNNIIESVSLTFTAIETEIRHDQ